MVAAVAVAAGAIGLCGTTVAAAAPAGGASADNVWGCTTYLARGGYTVGPKVRSACTTAARGFQAICEVSLVDIGVSKTDAAHACALGKD